MSTMPVEIHPNPEGAEETRNPKPETRKKAEIRRPKDLNIEHTMAVAAAFQVLDVGCSSPFFGLRSSGFGFGMARAR